MKEASEFFSRALEGRPTGPTYGSAQIYESWARGYRQISDWDRTGNYMRKALLECQELNQLSLNTAFYLEMLALVKDYSGEYREATRLAERSFNICTRLRATRTILAEGILNNLGLFAQKVGSLEAAEAWLQQALSIGLQIDPKGEITAIAYGNLGLVASDRGDLAMAEKYFLQSLDISQRFQPDSPALSNAWGYLGDVALSRKNFARAEQYLIRALALERKQGGPRFEGRLAINLNNLADLKREMGDRTGAVALLRQALAIQERVAPRSKEIADTLLTYGTALQELGDFRVAKEVFLRALTLAEKINLRSFESADARYHIGGLYAEQGDLIQAEHEIKIAADIHHRLAPKGAWYAESLGALAAVEEQLGRPAAAMRHYAKALAVLDSQTSRLGGGNNIHFSSANSSYYARFAALLLAQGQTRRAFQTLDRSRARTLVRTLAEDHINIRSGIPSALLENERKLEALLLDLSDQRIRVLTERYSSKGIAGIDSRIADAAAEHELAEARMRAANPRYAALTQPSPPSLRQIQESLGPDTALLEYSLNKGHSYLFALDRNRLSSFQLPPRAELDRLARATYGYWSKPGGNPELGTIAQQLSDLALNPAADFIKGHRRLLIVADGSLQYIPFAALPMPRRSAASGQRLASQYEVVNLPSASLLVMLRQHPTTKNLTRNAIAIIGDPVFSKDDPRVIGGFQSQPVALSASRGAETSPAEDDDMRSLLEDDTSTRGLLLNRLIHSREEAEAIASASSKDRVLMALDFDASRTNALDPKVTHSRIIHFATHGVFDSKNPAMSGLVLSLVDKQGKPQPGFLGLDEIYSSRLSADLVVASACETALGEEINGEGLVGLTWGFIYAGAKSVVASLWRVNDASTAELMRLFYTGIERQGLTPAGALRQAQMAISRKPEWASPYYWAGFVIEGEYAK
jgi:CHAT domain-containing protein/tetratricopeptide (TPR) repeat protein